MIRSLRAVVCLWMLLVLATPLLAGTRVPGASWMHYATPAEAGFDAAKLEAAHQTWQQLPSSAFLVIADGAVVADWGETDRRFMCHSVRKSFLAALYGIYYERGEIELNKTLADLGIDDAPDPLLDTEKRARILDLLKARSGVFHPAAYAGRTDSRPRGSEGPGRYFAYNNWDFNTLAAILRQETGADVFESFDTHFGKPLQMQDWRISDGYYHYELDKSKYPAYPFRLSARDAARFGLLMAREGMWGDTRILSRNWVRRCTAEYSIDNEVRGYGFMWWTFREPRFQQYGMVAALGVGNQMIAVLPDIDMVIVNRANTYEGERTAEKALLDLIEQVLQARSGAAQSKAKLQMRAQPATPQIRDVPVAQLANLVGTWTYPPPSLQLAEQTKFEVTIEDGHLLADISGFGTFRLYKQEDGSFREEDTNQRYTALYTQNGDVDGFADAEVLSLAAIQSLADGHRSRGEELLRPLANDKSVEAVVGTAIYRIADGDAERAEADLRKSIATDNAARIEGAVNAAAYGFLQQEELPRAQQIFELNTRLFPESANGWDSLGEAHMLLKNDDKAVECYQKSLQLNPDNKNAESMIAKIRERNAG